MNFDKRNAAIGTWNVRSDFEALVGLPSTRNALSARPSVEGVNMGPISFKRH